MSPPFVNIALITCIIIGAVASLILVGTIGALSTTIFTAKGFAKSFKIIKKFQFKWNVRGWSESLIKDTILKNVGRKTVSTISMSGSVTNLVKRIEMSDGRILSYEYDKEERIRKVSESDKSAPDTVVSETVYTYDSLGQLIKETRDGVVINEMTYDKYGNIKTRNGIAYTYGNSIWKDQLTGYGDKSILI